MSASLPRADKVIARGSWQGAPADRVRLDYEGRFRRRIVLDGEAGLRFLLDLEKPQLLADGDGLALDDGRIVAVEAAEEELAEVSCANADELVRVAWHLGNRHLPVQLLAGKLRIRRDPVIIDMLRGLGAIVTLIEAPFVPEGGAYGHGRVQGHDHAHDHSHSHDHPHHHGHSHG